MQMIYLSQSQKINIQNCNLDTEILAIRKTGSTIEIITLNKSDLTCWQIFLRFWGCGVLAGTTTDLTKVASYLAKYNWKLNISNDLGGFNVYLKICELANKAFISRNTDNLYKKVSLQSKNIPILLRQRRAGLIVTDYLYTQMNVGNGYSTVYPDSPVFYWNPRCQVKHLLHTAHRHFIGEGTLFAAKISSPKGSPLGDSFRQWKSEDAISYDDLQSMKVVYQLQGEEEVKRSGVFKDAHTDFILSVVRASQKAKVFSNRDPHPTY